MFLLGLEFWAASQKDNLTKIVEALERKTQKDQSLENLSTGNVSKTVFLVSLSSCQISHTLCKSFFGFVL